MEVLLIGGRMDKKTTLIRDNQTYISAAVPNEEPIPDLGYETLEHSPSFTSQLYRIETLYCDGNEIKVAIYEKMSTYAMLMKVLSYYSKGGRQ